VKTLTIADVAGNEERRLLARVEPGYPQALRERSIGGTVRLKVTIAANGIVENAELLGGNPILGDAAIVAVTKWKYSPAAARTTAVVSIPFDPQR
jgi:TonB family protein